MMDSIQIPLSLRDYLERLNYCENRYFDLLETVSKDYMTEEEWNSSYDYYSMLYEESKLSKAFALEEISSIYKDKIGKKCWYIDFPNSCIVIGCPSNNKVTPTLEQYQDQIYRLFPELNKQEELHINGTHVKDITLQVTESCNMACTYCYQHSKMKNSMTFEVAKNFIDLILNADFKSNSYINANTSVGAIINFIGGEPWLEIDLIEQVSQYFINELFRRKHPWAIYFLFNICSNGLLHSNTKVQTYLKKHIKHLSYSISIDGDKDLHDTCRIDCLGNPTYDKVIQSVKDYQSTFSVPLGSKITISPNNVDKINKAVQSMIIDNNYNAINLNCVYEKGWTVDCAKILYKELCDLTDWLFENNLQDEIILSIFSEACGKPQGEDENNNWCGGLGLMIAVDCKGKIYPCLRYMETSSNKNFPKFIIGDIENGINILPEHKSRIECMQCITRKSQSTPECFNCPISSGCGWCSAYNYEEFGTPNKRATYICDMHKARVLANAYYWNRRGKKFILNCPKEWALEIIDENEYNKLKMMESDFNGRGF